MVPLFVSLWNKMLYATLLFRLRLLNVHDSTIPIDEPGVIVIQIDGLGHDVLVQTMKRGAAPFLRSLIRRNRYTFGSYFCGVPSITTAVEAELIFGKSDQIPAYSWFHRKLGRFIRGDTAGQAKLLEETMFAGVTHPLIKNGSGIASAYSGRATMTNISPQSQAEKSQLHRYVRLRMLLVPLLNPFRFWRMILVLAGSVIVMIVQAIKNKSKTLFWDEFWTLVIRLFLCDLAVAIAVNDLWRKTPALFINLSLVDKVSHTHGIRNRIVSQSIRLIDLYCKKLYDSARVAKRKYQYIVLSDHGQSPGIPFETITGETLPQLVNRGIGDDGPKTLLTYGNEDTLAQNKTSDTIFALPSSSIAHLYFSRWLPDQATRETIEKYFPNLIPTLMTHPGIGWIMVKNNDGTTTLLAQNNASATFQKGAISSVHGKPINLPDAKLLLSALARLSTCDNNGDLVLFGGKYGNAWASFEPYIGTHGSFTGEMVKPFLLTNDPKLSTLLTNGASYRDLFKRIREMRGKKSDIA
ncbi:MAG: alkaline phosphatase family protein [Candidatus Gottesmanbacteria bacterium]|nr:alkaline phosphatase family protein [Candidatus Gottesmanbacteria bacterium]